jgi:hypothetical protein
MNRRRLIALTAYSALAGTGAALFRPAAAAGNPTALNAVPPELTGGPWLNTPKNEPLPLSARRGKVTVVHFWTFG